MNIKKYRLLKGKTQQEVAQDLNITQFTLSNYENGKTQPNLEILIKLSTYFNVSVDDLLGLENKNTNLNKQQLELLEFAKLINNDIDMGKLIGYAKSLAEKQISTEQKILNTLKEINDK